MQVAVVAISIAVSASICLAVVFIAVGSSICVFLKKRPKSIYGVDAETIIMVCFTSYM